MVSHKSLVATYVDKRWEEQISTKMLYLLPEGKPAHTLISKRHWHFLLDSCLGNSLPVPYYLDHFVATLPQVMSCTSSNGSLPCTLNIFMKSDFAVDR